MIEVTFDFIGEPGHMILGQGEVYSYKRRFLTDGLFDWFRNFQQRTEDTVPKILGRTEGTLLDRFASEIGAI